MSEFGPTTRAVAVVGGGVIGQSWAALFAARGLTVSIVDPRPDLAESLAASLPVAVGQVPGFAGDVGEAVARVTAHPSLAEAVRDADAVQEAGPETAGFKQATWQRVERVARPDALLLSSSSGIVASEQARGMADPARLVIGHPFNPPHILPLVEVSADAATPQPAIDAAIAFYRSLGKHPVRLHKEVPGFVANRLQMALLDEAITLVDAGVVGVDELDEIVTSSLGIRWASVGPLLGFHLGGGPGGLRHQLTHIGVGLARDIGQPDVLAPEVIDRVSTATEAAYPIARFTDYQAERDRRQAVVIADRAAHPGLG